MPLLPIQIPTSFAFFRSCPFPPPLIAPLAFYYYSHCSTPAMQTHQGSDHCPIAARFSHPRLLFHPTSQTFPALCAKVLPGARQRQGTLFETAKFGTKGKNDNPKKSPSAFTSGLQFFSRSSAIPDPTDRILIDLDSPTEDTKDGTSVDLGKSEKLNLEKLEVPEDQRPNDIFVIYRSQGREFKDVERTGREFKDVERTGREFKDVERTGREFKDVERTDRLCVYVNIIPSSFGHDSTLKYPSAHSDNNDNKNPSEDRDDNSDGNNDDISLEWYSDIALLIIRAPSIPENLGSSFFLSDIIQSTRANPTSPFVNGTSGSLVAEFGKLIDQRGVSDHRLLSNSVIEFCETLTRLGIDNCVIISNHEILSSELLQFAGVLKTETVNFGGPDLIFVKVGEEGEEVSPLEQREYRHSMNEVTSGHHGASLSMDETEERRTESEKRGANEGEKMEEKEQEEKEEEEKEILVKTQVVGQLSQRAIIRFGLTEEELLEKIRFLGDKEKKAYIETANEAPLCHGHKRRVKKSGANQGREFWTCILPDGPAGDPNGRCNTFQWGGAGTIGVPRWAMSNKSLENK